LCVPVAILISGGTFKKALLSDGSAFFSSKLIAYYAAAESVFAAGLLIKI
jgi:hypothetical protein